ncbi:MAG: flavin reductase [Oscillibacter sp.]|nr:flavin reductase [Oscillibacter sp.]
MDTKAFYKLTYGLFLLTAREEGRDNGCIINTAIQVANDPARISIAVLKGNHTHDMIARTGVFAISSISTSATFDLFQRFGMQSGREVDKFEGFADVERGGNDLLYLTKGANMTMSGKIVDQLDLGSHTLFIGEVGDAVVLSDEPSCTYAYYQSDIKPKKQEEKKKGWVCSVCGYVYEGDPLPADFICPWCKHGAEDFEPLQ